MATSTHYQFAAKNVKRQHRPSPGLTAIASPHQAAATSTTAAASPAAPASTPAAAPVKPKAPPEDSIATQWANRLLKGVDGAWCAEATHGSGGSVVYRWDQSYWAEVGSQDGTAMCAKWLHQTKPDRATKRAAMDGWEFGAFRLRSDRPLPKTPEGLVVIPTKNAYLHLDKKGKITVGSPDPKLGMTYAVSVNVATPVGQEHIVSEVPPDSLFGRFLATSLPDEDVRALVQEQAGLTLLPASYAIAAWWVGKGRNGKSVLMEILEKFHQKAARVSLQQLNDSFGMESIVGASLVLVDEVDALRWAEGKWKSLVAGNGVSVNRKGEKALISYRSRAKWIISANGTPFVYDRSDAIWERLCIVEWKVKIAEKDRVPDLETKIMEKEAHIVLDWLLEGAQRIVERGRFKTEAERPEAVRMAKTNARLETDSIAAWASSTGACCSDTILHTKDEVLAAYENWCAEEHREALERGRFWRAVKSSPSFTDLKEPTKRFVGGQKRMVNIALTEADRAMRLSPAAEAAMAAMPAIEIFQPGQDDLGWGS